MLDFTISGAGVLSDSGGGSQDSGQSATAAAPSRDSRPGGGIGPPIDAPDPLEKYRWYILVGFAIVLTAGAFYIVGGSKARAAAGWAPAKIDRPEPSPAQKLKPPGQSAVLMEALKEEIFQLELEHKQGRISQQEYEKAKAALDQTLERAVRRTATSKTT